MAEKTSCRGHGLLRFFRGYRSALRDQRRLVYGVVREWREGFSIPSRRATSFGTLADHTFNLPLKKGRNLIVVEVLSGTQGWSFDFGGPKERQVAVTSGNDPDQISATETSGGQTSNPVAVSIQLQDVVPPIDATAPMDQLSTWMPLEPLAVPDGQLHEKICG